MKRIKKFLVSFIPRHVSNRTFLRMYQITALLPVSRKNREKNYDSNIAQLDNTDWDFWTVPSAYIENQNEWDKIMFGANAHSNMRFAGCEIMATFNAQKALMGTGSPEMMARLIRKYEARGAALCGIFGVSPRAIEDYFRKQGVFVMTTDKGDSESLNIVDSKSQVLIATVYNDVNDITKQVHTVCITKDTGNGYVLHNAYRKDKNGTYVASDPYSTLSDAISNISRNEAKLIYLIGIASILAH